MLCYVVLLCCDAVQYKRAAIQTLRHNTTQSSVFHHLQCNGRVQAYHAQRDNFHPQDLHTYDMSTYHVSVSQVDHLLGLCDVASDSQTEGDTNLASRLQLNVHCRGEE